MNNDDYGFGVAQTRFNLGQVIFILEPDGIKQVFISRLTGQTDGRSSKWVYHYKSDLKNDNEDIGTFEPDERLYAFDEETLKGLL